jgi:hypothetical protein
VFGYYYFLYFVNIIGAVDIESGYGYVGGVLRGEVVVGIGVRIVDVVVILVVVHGGVHWLEEEREKERSSDSGHWLGVGVCLVRLCGDGAWDWETLCVGDAGKDVVVIWRLFLVLVWPSLVRISETASDNAISHGS